VTATCPNGHTSSWPDWCSTCGERLADSSADVGASATPSPAATAAPEASAAPAPTGPTCDNCGVDRHEHDVFCESCGLDFATGTLPEGTEQSQQSPSGEQPADATNGNSSIASFDPMHAKVEVDSDFFAASVGDVDLALPNPLPAQQMVPLASIRILIGRTSNSRGIFPEIDVEALTEDPAVSSRHAMLERDPMGKWTLTDLGSTNGTFLTAAAQDPIEAGVALPIEVGDSIYVGAWTRIDLAATSI